MACMFYFALCINIIFNSLLVQLVKYDIHTTRKIKFIHAICYHLLLFYVTEISHLYSLREFQRHFVCVGLRRIVTVAFFAPCTNILTYLLTTAYTRTVAPLVVPPRSATMRCRLLTLLLLVSSDTEVRSFFQ